ncbi:MAG: methyltransferase domain-containing protein [Nitrospirae bacterium]|nr:methyltransferase domain-containing protein [Nitrospirota bacterium]
MKSKYKMFKIHFDRLFNIDIGAILRLICEISIRLTVFLNNQDKMIKRLREIVSDVSKQYFLPMIIDDYWDLKMRALHAFQCLMMLSVIKTLNKKRLTVVDIGDSSGTHMRYLKGLAGNEYEINTISVNLDARAIEKIKAQGQEAILCRAEDIDLKDRTIDLYTSFEMLEHLHNPAIFLYSLAKRGKCDVLLLTIPYLRRSRVGLHYIRNGDLYKNRFAEDVHVFELSPEDWTLLFRHSGWIVQYSEIYLQYPKGIPILSSILAAFWRKIDYEGFWGVILKRDTSVSDCYLDWEQ